MRALFRPCYLLLVVAATGVVVGAPTVLVLILHTNGIVTSLWAGLVLAGVLALVASFGGSALWQRHRLVRDAVFSDLLAWGWLRRIYIERRITRTLSSLDKLGREHVEPRTKLLERLAIALDERDVYLHGHSRRVARHATGTAMHMRLAHEDVISLQMAALLHDVGKLHTPPEVLRKRGRLTDDEFVVIKQHAAQGATMVATLGDPKLADIIRHHHERVDGSGYPDGEVGSAIPLGARIIAVADTFDAITSDRPYRPGAPHKRALDILRKQAGTQLDRDVVHAFIAYYSDRAWAVVLAEVGSPQTGLMRALRSGLIASFAAVVATGIVAATTQTNAGAHQRGIQSAPASGGTIHGGLVPAPTTSSTPTTPVTPSTATSPPSTTKTLTSSTTAKAPPARPVPVAKPAPAAKPVPPPGTAQVHQPTHAPALHAVLIATAARTNPMTPLRFDYPPLAKVFAPSPATPAPTTTATSRPPTTTSAATTTTTTPAATNTSTVTSTTPTETGTTSTLTSTTPTTTGTSTTSPTPPDQCKNGGWRLLGFRNQGQCESSLHKP